VTQPALSGRLYLVNDQPDEDLDGIFARPAGDIFDGIEAGIEYLNEHGVE
jgi:hypothetical protein